MCPLARLSQLTIGSLPSSIRYASVPLERSNIPSIAAPPPAAP